MTANTPTDAPSPIFEYRIHAVENKVEKTNDDLKALTVKLPEQFATAINSQGTLYRDFVTGIGFWITLLTIGGGILIKRMIESKIDEQVKQKTDLKIAEIDKKFAELYQQNKDYVKRRFEAEGFTERGNKAYNDTKYDEAIMNFTQSLNLHESALAYYNLGVTRQAMGQYEPALENYNKAIGLEPNYFEAQLNHARVRELQQEYVVALLEYNALIKHFPQYAEPYCNRSHVQLKLGNFPQALEDAQTSITLNPYYKQSYNNCGMALSILERFPEAIVQFDKALAIDNKYEIAYFGRAQAKLYSSDGEGAIKDINSCLEINPNNSPALYVKAIALAIMEFDENKVFDSLKKAIALNEVHRITAQEEPSFGKYEYNAEFRTLVGLPPLTDPIPS